MNQINYLVAFTALTIGYQHFEQAKAEYYAEQHRNDTNNYYNQYGLPIQQARKIDSTLFIQATGDKHRTPTLTQRTMIMKPVIAEYKKSKK